MADKNDEIQKLVDEIEKRHGKSIQQLIEEREKRVNDAIALREPDRVPVTLGTGVFADYRGVDLVVPGSVVVGGGYGCVGRTCLYSDGNTVY